MWLLSYASLTIVCWEDRQEACQATFSLVSNVRSKEIVFQDFHLTNYTFLPLNLTLKMRFLTWSKFCNRLVFISTLGMGRLMCLACESDVNTSESGTRRWWLQ